MVLVGMDKDNISMASDRGNLHFLQFLLPIVDAIALTVQIVSLSANYLQLFFVITNFFDTFGQDFAKTASRYTKTKNHRS
jgi:hypothetical protein